jgi:hypothetical protein
MMFPLRSTGTDPASPPWRPSLVESAALQSVVGTEVPELLGYSDPAVASPFRADRCGLSSIPSPVIQRITGSSSRELRPPSEHSCRCLLAALRHRAPSMGFPSLFATSMIGVHASRGASRAPPSFRPQCFAHSRRVPPPVTLQACFILLPRPGFTLQGFPPTRQRRHLVGDADPLAVGVHPLPDCSGAGSGRVDLRVLVRLVIRNRRRGNYPVLRSVSPRAVRFGLRCSGERRGVARPTMPGGPLRPPSRIERGASAVPRRRRSQRRDPSSRSRTASCRRRRHRCGHAVPRRWTTTRPRREAACFARGRPCRRQLCRERAPRVIVRQRFGEESPFA